MGFLDDLVGKVAGRSKVRKAREVLVEGVLAC